MTNNLNTLLRDLLPIKLQVPSKYWYGRLLGKLEPEMEFLQYIVRNHDRVIDIGGNRGIYAYHLWRLGAKIEVFEPNPTCHSILSAWSCGKSDINVYSVALSNCIGTTNLHIPIDESGVEHDASASIENNGFARARDQPIQLNTLDSYSFKDVKLIKIDVEGHEYNVIDGAAKTILSSMPALLVEIEQRHIARPIDDVFEKILSFGYQGYFMDKGGLTELANFSAKLHQSMGNFINGKNTYINNFLFLHRDKLATGEYCQFTNKLLIK